MSVKTKKKMSKKLIASIVVLALVSLASIAGIVTVLALTQRSIDSAIFIRFTAIDIDGEVEAQYRVGTGEWKPMGEKHVFNAADEEENAQMNPGNISLSSANNFVEFRYTFRNFGDADYTGLLTLDEVDQNDNMEIEYKYNDSAYSTASYGLVVEGVDTAENTDTNAEGKKYSEMTYYIKVGVKELSKSASYSSDFFWLLERYDGEVTGEVIPIATSEYVANGDGTYTASYNGSNISVAGTSAGENGISNVWIVPNNIGSAAVTKVARGNDLPANTKVVLGDNVTTIENGTFYDAINYEGSSGLVEIVIGNGLTEIPDEAFKWCLNLKRITIGSNVTTIGDYAFNCCSLKEIIIPSSVTSMGDYSFQGCSSLKEITIPSSVTSIGENAFAYCTAVETLNYNASVTTVFGNSPFAGLGENATKTIVNIDSEVVTGMFLQNCTAVDEINFSSNVKDIQIMAFSGCTGLSKVTIPSDVTIGATVFFGCAGLTEVTFLGDAKLDGVIIFSGCTSLETVTFNEGLKEIQSAQMFVNCSSLTSIVFPASLTYVRGNIFDNCENLSSIEFKNPNGWNGYEFDPAATTDEYTSTGSMNFSETNFSANAELFKSTEVVYFQRG